MADSASGSSIRVYFSGLNEESSALVMRSERTLENTPAITIKNVNTANDVETAMEADEEASDGPANSAIEVGRESATVAQVLEEAFNNPDIDDVINVDRSERISNDSLKIDVISNCRLIKEEKRVATVELPDFKDGFTLEALIKFFQDVLDRYGRIPFLRFRLFFLAFLLGSFFILPGFISGVIFGIYLSMILFLFVCVSDSIPDSTKAPPTCEKILNEITMEATKEEKSRNIYKGWMNILNEHYNPHTFHVNTIQTVLVRLDGNMLRISRPDRAMLKHTFHTDPTLTESEPRMLSQSIYDLTNASVKLRPRRLARRRWFSRKYPICIRLASSQKKLDYYPRHGSSIHSFQNDHKERLGSPARSQNRMDDAASLSSAEAEDSASLSSMQLAQDSHTIAEIGREADVDGYVCDEDSSAVESEDEAFMRRSASDLNVTPSSGFKTDFTKIKKNPLNVSRSKCTRNIYLFARSAREKERWFNKLRKACSKYMLEKSFPDLECSASRRRISLPSSDFLRTKLSEEYFLYILQNLQFSKHLDTIIQDSSEKNNECINGTVLMDLGRFINKWSPPKNEASDEFVVMFNLLVSRIFYDFCRDEYWVKAVQNKIQSKLATIHLPYFIETLELSKLDIGTAIPRILKVYTATVDEWGIWVDFEIRYEGLITLILETKLNLMKLKDQNDAVESPTKNIGIVPFSTSALRSTPSRYSDEEIPESPETSPDEEFGCKVKRDDNGNVKKKTGKKILKFVDKITQSKYFKEATELKPIRKMMEEISSTRLILNVEVTALEGTMTLNVPPPPSDRLWYGFRKPPKEFKIKGVPQVGDRSVVLSTISDWIENKIRLVLEKNLVCPNMDDIVIPVLSGNELLQGNLNK